MLNDKEFEEIGKRLYDLEDDPPQGGWEKIASELTGDDREKPPFMWKNGWKFLPLLLIPALTYWLWPDAVSVKNIASSAGIGSALPQLQDNNANTYDSIREIENENAVEDIRIQDQVISVDADKKTHAFVEGSTSEGKSGIQPNKGTRLERIDNQSGRNADKLNTVVDNNTSSFTDVASKITAGTDQTSLNKTDELIQSVNTQEPQSLEDETLVIITETAQTHLPENSSGEETSSAKTNAVPTIPVTANPVEVAADSVGSDKDPVATAEPSADDVRDETKIGYGPWRLSMAAIPQFTDQSILPTANDETFVTSVGSRSKYPAYTGMGVAFGVGRPIKKNFYVDAQLSYTRTKHDVSYTYATGKIDTLIAQLREDGTVTMVPVYDLATAEKDVAFTKGGLSIMTTYYFWQNPVRRFSLSAGAGVNYLLSAKLTERSTGDELPSGGYLADRMNYSFFFAAGYNVTIGKGWEVMISPMLNYNLKKISNGQQPFEFTKRSYGMNIILLKSLF